MVRQVKIYIPKKQGENFKVVILIKTKEMLKVKGNLANSAKVDGHKPEAKPGPMLKFTFLTDLSLL